MHATLTLRVQRPPRDPLHSGYAHEAYGCASSLRSLTIHACDARTFSHALFPFVIAQVDLGAKRVVTTQAGRDLAEGLGIPFFETSAKGNIGVAEPFVECARRALGTLRGDKAPTGGAFSMFDASMMFDKLGNVSFVRARGNMPPSLFDVGTHVTLCL